MQPETAQNTQIDWPSKRVEAFRFTPLNDRGLDALIPARAATPAPAFDAGLADAIQLNFVAGKLMSDMAEQAFSLNRLSDDKPAKDMLHSLLPADHPSAQSADMGAGWVLDIAAGIEIEQPILLSFTGGALDEVASPVIVIRLGAGAKATIAEAHSTDLGLNAPVMFYDIAADAKLDHAKWQAEGKATTHLGLSLFQLAEKADMASLTLSMGAKLARCESHALLAGEEVNIALHNLYLGKDKQHLDTTTRLHHAVPNCCSDQVIRGVLDDSATGVFQGQIRVAPDAQKTDGQQMSRALLLSRDAEVHTKPELEIFADDVVCSHGATVGELDERQLFYLMARGIDRDTARALLIEAFLIEALDEIRSPVLSAWLNKPVAAWLGKSDGEEAA